MLGAVRVRGEVPAQVNKAVDVEPGCVEKNKALQTDSWRWQSQTAQTAFYSEFAPSVNQGNCPAPMSFSRSTFSDCVC